MPALGHQDAPPAADPRATKLAGIVLVTISIAAAAVSGARLRTLLDELASGERPEAMHRVAGGFVPAPPLKGRISQGYMPSGELLGVDFTLRSVAPTTVRFRLTVVAPKETILRESVFQVAAAPGEQVVRARFKRVDIPAAEVRFVIDPIDPTDGVEIALADHPLGGVFLNFDLKPGSSSLLYRPVYGWTPAMTMRRVLQALAYAFWALAVIVFTVLVRRAPVIGTTLAAALMLVFCSLVRHPFSIADEGGHFSYITFLMDEGRLPQTTMPMPVEQSIAVQNEIGEMDMVSRTSIPFYEAVQMPLYYVLMALVGKLAWAMTGSWAFVLYAVRTFGSILVAIGCGLILRTLLTAARQLQPPIALSPLAITLAAATFFLSPATLGVLTTITNDQLAFTSGALAFHFFLRAALRNEWTKQTVLPLALSCGVVWLSKLTGAYVCFLVLLYLVGSGRGRMTGLFVLVVGVMIVPIHFHNWQVYNALTGIEHQIAFVKTIVNPNNVFTPLSEIVLSAGARFFLSFHYDYAYPVSERQQWFCNLLAWVMVLGILVAIGRGARSLRGGLRPLFRDGDRRPYFDGLIVAGTMAPCMVVCVGTYSNQIDLLHPRFAFPSMLCFVAAYLIVLEYVRPRWLATWVAALGLVVIVLVSIGFTDGIRPYRAL